MTVVDHVYVELADAEAVFDAMTERLALPVAWPFREVTRGFGSGGVSLGNLIVEFVRSDEPGPVTGFGVALAGSRSRLAELGYELGEEIPSLSGDVVLWTSTYVRALSGDGMTTFLCDYTADPRVWHDRCRTELAGRGGGALGVVGVTELVVESVGPDAKARDWAAIVDDGDLEVQVVPGEREGLRSLTVWVRDPVAADQTFRRTVPGTGPLGWHFVS